MPNIITAVRLREIKARTGGGAYTYGPYYGDVHDLAATLERAVELLRDVECPCGEEVCICGRKERVKFFGEFDHE